MKNILQIMTCGSVDDGKSTLIGRLLYELDSIYLDQLDTLKKDSQKYGTQGDQIDFALLMDGLSAEREQGITIDVAYRHLSSPRRRFILADTPGHVQYTRNMMTAASSSDAAIVLVDATKGISQQTRRHLFLCDLMKVHHVIVVINKMDAVHYSKEIFDRLSAELVDLKSRFSFRTFQLIPVSALKGDFLVHSSLTMPWYSGPTVLECIETLEIEESSQSQAVFPVQMVMRPHSEFRGFAGTLAQGELKKSDRIQNLTSGVSAQITDILQGGQSVDHATQGDALVVKLDRELDVSRGDILAHPNSNVEKGQQLEATLVWLVDQVGHIGRQYDLKLSHQWTQASLHHIKHRLNSSTFEPESASDLHLNDIAKIQFWTSKPLFFLPYEQSKDLGGFILVDRMTQQTVAAGMIDFALRRGSNTTFQSFEVNRQIREASYRHAGKVIWFTGLSGSGKSTIANALEKQLFHSGIRTYILDGDNIRQGLNKDLGFTESDRIENIRRVAEVAKLFLDAGLVVMVSFISPYEADREMARDLIGRDSFIEVYLSTSLQVCETRDPKGLYRKARMGQIPNFTGIGSPYEVPADPDFTFDTSNQSVETIVEELIRRIR